MYEHLLLYHGHQLLDVSVLLLIMFTYQKSLLRCKIAQRCFMSEPTSSVWHWLIWNEQLNRWGDGKWRSNDKREEGDIFLSLSPAAVITSPLISPSLFHTITWRATERHWISIDVSLLAELNHLLSHLKTFDVTATGWVVEENIWCDPDVKYIFIFKLIFLK